MSFKAKRQHPEHPDIKYLLGDFIESVFLADGPNITDLHAVIYCSQFNVNMNNNLDYLDCSYWLKQTLNLFEPTSCRLLSNNELETQKHFS